MYKNTSSTNTRAAAMEPTVTSKQAAAIAMVDENTLKLRRREGILAMGQRDGRTLRHGWYDVLILAVVEAIHDSRKNLKSIYDETLFALNNLHKYISPENETDGVWLLRCRHYDGSYSTWIGGSADAVTYRIEELSPHCLSCQVIPLGKIFDRVCQAVNTAPEVTLEELCARIAHQNELEEMHFSNAEDYVDAMLSDWFRAIPLHDHVRFRREEPGSGCPEISEEKLAELTARRKAWNSLSADEHAALRGRNREKAAEVKATANGILSAYEAELKALIASGNCTDDAKREIWRKARPIARTLNDVDLVLMSEP